METPAFITAHEQWVSNVELSELPVYLVEMYGVPHIDNPPFDELSNTECDERG